MMSLQHWFIFSKITVCICGQSTISWVESGSDIAVSLAIGVAAKFHFKHPGDPGSRAHCSFPLLQYSMHTGGLVPSIFHVIKDVRCNTSKAVTVITEILRKHTRPWFEFSWVCTLSSLRQYLDITLSFGAGAGQFFPEVKKGLHPPGG